jgi:hypothetical protein
MNDRYKVKNFNGFEKDIVVFAPVRTVKVGRSNSLPRIRMYSNLRQLGVINGSNKVKVEVDVKRMNQFVARSLPQNELDFAIPVRLCVP